MSKFTNGTILEVGMFHPLIPSIGSLIEVLMLSWRRSIYVHNIFERFFTGNQWGVSGCQVFPLRNPSICIALCPATIFGRLLTIWSENANEGFTSALLSCKFSRSAWATVPILIPLPAWPFNIRYYAKDHRDLGIFAMDLSSSTTECWRAYGIHGWAARIPQRRVSGGAFGPQ
jgi:hypothetical protein